MTNSKPFLPTAALDALPKDAVGDFLLPMCTPDIGLLMGEDLAVVVLTTVEGQRVGVPIGVRALSDLQVTISEALRLMQAPEGGSVQ